MVHQISHFFNLARCEIDIVNSREIVRSREIVFSLNFPHILAIFDDISKLYSTFGTHYFKKSSNIAKFS